MQLLRVILSVIGISELLMIIFPQTDHPYGMAPFGSRPAAGRRARLR